MEGIWSLKKLGMLVVKNPPAKAGYAGHAGSIPGLGRSPGGGNGNPLQYSCLGNPMGRGAWLGYSPWDHEESDMTEHSTAHSKDEY